MACKRSGVRIPIAPQIRSKIRTDRTAGTAVKYRNGGPVGRRTCVRIGCHLASSSLRGHWAPELRAGADEPATWLIPPLRCRCRWQMVTTRLFPDSRSCRWLLLLLQVVSCVWGPRDGAEAAILINGSAAGAHAGQPRQGEGAAPARRAARLLRRGAVEAQPLIELGEPGPPGDGRVVSVTRCQLEGVRPACNRMDRSPRESPPHAGDARGQRRQRCPGQGHEARSHPHVALLTIVTITTY